MKIIYYGEGDPAWLEPENEADERLLEEAAAQDWTFEQTVAKSNITVPQSDWSGHA